MQSASTNAEVWTGGKNPWVIAVVVTIATFMEMLDSSIANVALPQMAGNLSVTYDRTTWVITSYLVTNAIVLPISGWLATKIGRKRYYMFSVVLFTLSSLLCGFAPSLEWLVFFRLLQGIGGGGLAPTEQSILADTFPESKRGMAMALYGMAIITAPAIGPTVGGIITDHASWRWLFLINVPVGAMSLVLTQHYVSDPPHMKVKQAATGAVDYVGLGLLTVALGCLELTLSRGQEEDWFHSHEITLYAFTSAVTFVSFVFWEWQQESPIVEVRLFKLPGFAAVNLMMMCIAVVLYATTILLPQYTQSVMRYTAQQAGAVLSPGGLVVILLMPFVGGLTAKADARILVAFGFTVTSLSLFYMAHHLYPGIDMSSAIIMRCCQTVGVAFLFVPINTLSYNGVPLAQRHAVSSIVNLSRNIGGELGVAFVTTLIARRTQVHQAQLGEHVMNDLPGVRAALGALTNTLQRSGAAGQEALHKAQALIYQRLQVESMTLSTLDALYILGICAACMVPLVCMVRRSSAEQETAWE
jgi:DHA2 family multidrug resistance protein